VLGHQLVNRGVIVQSSNHTTFLIALACGLMEQGMGADQVEQQLGVPPQPDRNGWDKADERWREGDDNP
jgi:hypothetical protein